MYAFLKNLTLMIVLAASLTACGAASRIRSIGQAPDLTPIQNVAAPARQRSISLPMPEPQVVQSQPNSLWRTGARAFFKDQRAAQVGDILTILIDIQDQASVDNTTTRSRTSGEDANMTNFLGLESKLGSSATCCSSVSRKSRSASPPPPTPISISPAISSRTI